MIASWKGLVLSNSFLVVTTFVTVTIHYASLRRSTLKGWSTPMNVSLGRWSRILANLLLANSSCQKKNGTKKSSLITKQIGERGEDAWRRIRRFLSCSHHQHNWWGGVLHSSAKRTCILNEFPSLWCTYKPLGGDRKDSLENKAFSNFLSQHNSSH